MSRNLLKSLIDSAEKAANIARKCREDKNLLSLLIQEKTADEANARFVHDFKTLADVLIQETIIHYIGNYFPELQSNIKGEESSTFTNTLGESVCVKIGENETETASCLEKVLDGNKIAANVLASEVHKNIELSSHFDNIPELPNDIDYLDIGIWIDPIDATSQYIAGDTIFTNFPGITSAGLDCVTVLIGAFSISTGIPIIGIVNQPFEKKLEGNSYKSKLFWGINFNGIIYNNVIETKIERPNKIALFSTSESPNIIEILKTMKYEVAFSSGAGHKALKVITGEAEVYLLSAGTTYKWDTCAPQAILRSLGGDVFDYKKSIEAKNLIPISYANENEKCNIGGVIAVQNKLLSEELLQNLS